MSRMMRPPSVSENSRRSSSVRTIALRQRTVHVAALQASHKFSREQLAIARHRRHRLRCARASGDGLGASEEDEVAPVAPRGESSSGSQSRKCAAG
eukprot:8825544-Alexandrium_andersonii.AAC.1